MLEDASARPAPHLMLKSKKEVKAEEDSADRSDGLGQYTRKEKVAKWLDETDNSLETIKETLKEV
jgi:hypothetical protein